MKKHSEIIFFFFFKYGKTEINAFLTIVGF